MSEVGTLTRIVGVTHATYRVSLPGVSGDLEFVRVSGGVSGWVEAQGES
jgi:hypothetical protein